MQRTTHYTLTADSRLTEDMLLVAELSVDPNVVGGVSVTTDSLGNSYLFAILAGQGAVHLEQSSSSASGYAVAPLPEGSAATEIVSLVDDMGVIHAWYAIPSAVLHTWLGDDGTWSASESFTAGTSLATTRPPLSNAWIVYSTGNDGNLVLYSLSTGSGPGGWSATTVDLEAALLGTAVRLQYTNNDAWELFGVVNGSLGIWSGRNTGVESGPYSISVANPVAHVHCTYYHENSAMVMFTDSQNILYSSVGFTDTPSAIPLSAIVQGSGIIGGDHLLRFYGADPNGNLWVLRQTDWDGNGAPIWAPIFPLDVEISYVASPAPVGGNGMLLVRRADDGIDLLRQPGDGSGAWNRVAIQGASPALPLRSVRYRTRLTITDGNGLPCANMSIAVTPSRLVALEVAGGSVVASPSQPANLTSDASGVIDFSQPATGLVAVTFQISGDGITTPITVTPHDYIHRQLAGTDPIFTGSATLPPMSCATLQNATVDGGPLASNLNNSADTAAQGIKSVMGVSGTSTAPEYAGCEIDLRDPDHPRFAHFRTRAELEERIAMLGAEAAESPWDAIANFADDVWQGIESGVMMVTQWVVDSENAVVVSAEVAFADVVAQLQNLPLDLVGIASMAQGIFNWIGAGLRKVLDWLKDQLAWRSIWNTMMAFDGYLIQGVQTVDQWLLDKAVVATGAFFHNLRTQFDQELASITVALGEEVLGPSNSTLGRIHAAGISDTMSPQAWASSAQGNWFFSKLNAYLPGSDFLSAVTPGLPDDMFDQIKSAIDNSGIVNDTSAALATFEQFLGQFYSNPQSLGKVRVSDLLNLLKALVDLALDGLDVLITIALDIAADIVAAVLNMFDTPLPDIPVLSWLWDNVLSPSGTSEPMTFGKLISMGFAVPVTLASIEDTGQGPYDNPAIQGAAAIEASDMREQVRSYFSIALAATDMLTDAANASNNVSNDENPNLVLLLINSFDWVANVVAHVLDWPVGDIFNMDWSWESMTLGQRIANGVWIGTWTPIVVDGIFTALDAMEVKGTIKLPPGTTNANVLLDTIYGLGLVVTGVVGTAAELNDEPPHATARDIVEAVVNPLPWFTQFLITKPLIESSDGLSILVQCIIDIIGDVYVPENNNATQPS